MLNVILGIDTSSVDLGIGLYRGNTAEASICRFVRNSHAEHITLAVKMILELNRVTADQVSHIAVTNGPGSFTGLRIGLAFVKGFCFGGIQKVLPLSSLHVLAHAVKAPAGSKVFTALDARQNHIQWASFESTGTDVIRLTDDTLSSADELLECLRPEDLVFTDTMGYVRSTVFTLLEGKAEIRPVDKIPLQRGLSCAAIANDLLSDQSSWQCACDVQPNYMRLSAAQEKTCP